MLVLFSQLNLSKQLGTLQALELISDLLLKFWGLAVHFFFLIWLVSDSRVNWSQFELTWTRKRTKAKTSHTACYGTLVHYRKYTWRPLVSGFMVYINIDVQWKTESVSEEITIAFGRSMAATYVQKCGSVTGVVAL